MNDLTRPNDFAFPHAIKSPSGDMLLNAGLTKREYFAAIAMHGIVANPSSSIDSVSRLAVEYADALIRELNKEPDEKTKV